MPISKRDLVHIRSLPKYSMCFVSAFNCPYLQHDLTTDDHLQFAL